MGMHVCDIKHLGGRLKKKNITAFYTRLFGRKYTFIVLKPVLQFIYAKAQIFFLQLFWSLIFTDVTLILEGPI